MKIKSIEISNILSIQNIKLEFGDSGLILLDGWNYDDDTANGAGKTAIFNCMAFGLYGKFPRKISVSEILRDGSKAGFVRIIFEAGTSLCEVYRAKPNDLKFYIDGLEKSMTQEEFETAIKLTYSQYLISMYSAQTEGLKLISLNDAAKKDFFLELMNFNSFADCKKEVDALLKELNRNKDDLQNKINILDSRISTYKESLIDVEAVNQEIEDCDLLGLVEKIKKLEFLKKPDTQELDALENELSEQLYTAQKARDDLLSKGQELARLKKLIAKLRIPLSEQVHCPECQAPVVLGEDGVTSFYALRNQREKELIATVTEYTELANLIKLAEIDAGQVNTIKQALLDCRQNRSVELEKFNKTKEQIIDLKSQLSYNKMRIQKLKLSLDKNTAVVEKIIGCKNEAISHEKAMLVIQNDIELNETISSLYSPTGAPAYVLDSTIDVFNDKVQQYVMMIWPNASYTLQSFKENKSGDVKAKFSEKLVISGKEKSIGALSGGEHRCLSLAVDFAVIDVLETMFNIYMTPIMMDEPFNALDASNRERVLELLEKMATRRQIWVIDHASEAKAMFSNTVRVEKRSGVSSLV